MMNISPRRERVSAGSAFAAVGDERSMPPDGGLNGSNQEGTGWGGALACTTWGRSEVLAAVRTLVRHFLQLDVTFGLRRVRFLAIV